MFIDGRSVSSRLVALVWYFFSLVIVAYYLGSIVMILTTERLMISSISSVEDLAQQQDVQYGCIVNGHVSRLFKVATLSVHPCNSVTDHCLLIFLYLELYPICENSTISGHFSGGHKSFF